MRFARKEGVLHGGRTQRFSECAKVVLRDFITVFDSERRPKHVIEQDSNGPLFSNSKLLSLFESTENDTAVIFPSPFSPHESVADISLAKLLHPLKRTN